MAHILLTSGPTRAYLDDVRYLTNGIEWSHGRRPRRGGTGRRGIA
jgi:Phosphopantothenoylcysteine synthetase/decarboxylase